MCVGGLVGEGQGAGEREEESAGATGERNRDENFYHNLRRYTHLYHDTLTLPSTAARAGAG